MLIIEEDYDVDDIFREEIAVFDNEENKESFNELYFECMRNHDVDEIISDLGKKNDLWER